MIDVPETSFVKRPPSSKARATERDRSPEVQPVDARDLASFRQSRAAENAARLEADKELLHALMLAAYSGPEWNRFSMVLAEYGMQVMSSWIRRGTIVEQCKKKRLGIPKLIARSTEDVHDLATETVVTAIIAFRNKVLIPRVWDPGKGASLMTFFVGQCVLQFPNIYRRWRSERIKQMSVEREVVAQELEHARAQPPSTQTIVELSRQVRDLTSRSAATAAVMLEIGYSVTEVSNEFEMTPRALESKLYRHRGGGS